MKKIGIVTFHNAYNYGAVLQCYALQKVLNVMNYDCEIIDYIDINVTDPYHFFPKKNRNLKSSIKNFIKVLMFYNKIKTRHRMFDEFMNIFCILSKTTFTKEDIYKDNLEEYDCLVTGSDQVWSISIVGELSDIYTLNIGSDNIKKISYAASVGDSKSIIQNKELFKKKISMIDYISVREDEVKQELEKLIHKPITVTLDPTLLLYKQNWCELINDERKPKEKYILAYLVAKDNEYIKIVNNLSKRTGLKVMHFDLYNPGYKNVLKSIYTEDPVGFINYIKNAEYVVTTSFHATVFSIIFHKKFFTVPHRETGNRVTNLLDCLDIKGRIFYSLEEFQNIDYTFETNWNTIDQNLDKERKKSIKWLINAIEN